MQKTKWNWSEESERDGVGRRPAVLFSPAVQTRDMWLPRQAVQSGRARWTHYRQGQDGIAWQNTIGSFGELERSKLNCVGLCVCVYERAHACVCLERHVWTTVHLLSPSVPPLAAPSPAPPWTCTHTKTHSHTNTTTYKLSMAGQKDCLNVFSCTGQLSDEVASHRLPLVGHFI